METIFILYVSSQVQSLNFYKLVLDSEPVLDVPGMTEFRLSDSSKLGLMPEDGINMIFDGKLPHPALGNGIPRCELYIKIKDATSRLDKITKAGATIISPLQERDWGDKVGYISDPDGHVIAIAE